MGLFNWGSKSGNHNHSPSASDVKEASYDQARSKGASREEAKEQAKQDSERYRAWEGCN